MKKIFFDFDGTLVDISEKYYRVYTDFMNAKSARPFSKKVFWRMVRRKENIERVVREKSFAEEYRQFFLENVEREKYLRHDRIFSFTKPTLRRLKDMQMGLFLVTVRRSDPAVLQEVRRMGLVFKKVLIGKPDKAVSNTKVKKELIDNIAAQGDVVVGDSEADITAGKALGMKTVAVLSGIRSYALLKKQSPDFIVRDIRSILKVI